MGTGKLSCTRTCEGEWAAVYPRERARLPAGSTMSLTNRGKTWRPTHISPVCRNWGIFRSLMINFQFQDGDTPLNIAEFQRKAEKDIIHLLSNPTSVREVSYGKSILICQCFWN